VGLAATPEGSFAVAASEDGQVSVFSLSGQRLGGWRVPGGAVTALAAADGLAAVAAADGRVTLWSLPDGEARGAFATGSGPAAGLAFGPEGRWLAVNAGKASGAVVLWDTRTLRVRRSLKGDTEPTCGVAVSPDGSRILCAGADESILVWDSLTGRALAEMRGHSSVVRCVAFSPGGKLAASGAADGTARIWDVARGVEVDAATGAVGPLRALAFTPDGLHLALAGQGQGDDEMPADVQLWSLAARRGVEVQRAHRGAAALLFSPTRSLMLTAGADRTIKWWSHPGPARSRELPRHTGRQGATSMDPSGKLLAWVAPPTHGGPDEVQVCEAETGALGTPLRGVQKPIRLVALVPGGRLAVTAGGDRGEEAEAYVWDLGTGRPVRVLAGLKGQCQGLAASADGKHLATASDDGARLWDLESGKLLWERPGKFAAAAFGGSLVAAVGDEGLRAWRLDGTEAGAVAAPSGMSCLAFTGEVAAFSGGDSGIVHLASLRDGEMAALDVGMNEVTHLAFSSDGKTLAVAGAATAVKLWDVASRLERAALGPHRGGACFAAFRADGSALITASRSGLARIWRRAG
jgi:WD40 repeat protein